MKVSTKHQQKAVLKIIHAASLLGMALNLIENDPEAPNAEASEDLQDAINQAQALLKNDTLIQDMGEEIEE